MKGLFAPFFGSSWVSPVQCVPKKGGVTIVKSENNEIIPTIIVTGWQIGIDYRNLNKKTQKDHFPLPLLDLMLDRLASIKLPSLAHTVCMLFSKCLLVCVMYLRLFKGDSYDDCLNNLALVLK
ncbi:Retrovirus-related Pol polyprotein from transposon opus [Gossypium australe]|uniref:Retrovirus-related Pol polyprotein from transposon opus n=1 Tax=Gossypium australe TaxID=47621 RepID=A0A5B6X1F4_9ROSI|nr:Retrovirus-related Pol polyprotein from transposon opus [Gossypium australe]